MFLTYLGCFACCTVESAVKCENCECVLISCLRIVVSVAYLSLRPADGYRSASRPSFLKTYLSSACNVPLTLDECEEDCIENLLNLIENTKLDRKIPNLTLNPKLNL